MGLIKRCWQDTGTHLQYLVIAGISITSSNRHSYSFRLKLKLGGFDCFNWWKFNSNPSKLYVELI